MVITAILFSKWGQADVVLYYITYILLFIIITHTTTDNIVQLFLLLRWCQPYNANKIIIRWCSRYRFNHNNRTYIISCTHNVIRVYNNNYMRTNLIRSWFFIVRGGCKLRLRYCTTTVSQYYLLFIILITNRILKYCNTHDRLPSTLLVSVRVGSMVHTHRLRGLYIDEKHLDASLE